MSFSVFTTTKSDYDFECPTCRKRYRAEWWDKEKHDCTIHFECWKCGAELEVETTVNINYKITIKEDY